MLTVGLSGASAHAAAAAADVTGVVGVCPQERLTRTRDAGFNASGLPDEAVDAVTRRGEARQQDVARYVIAGSAPVFTSLVPIEQISPHLAHAATAYLSSSFSDATIVVCDRSEPRISVWRGRDG